MHEEKEEERVVSCLDEWNIPREEQDLLEMNIDRIHKREAIQGLEILSIPE